MVRVEWADHRGAARACGYDVSFIARGAHLAASAATASCQSQAHGDIRIPTVRATDDPAPIGPVDVIILSVKLWDTETVRYLRSTGASCTRDQVVCLADWKRRHCVSSRQPSARGDQTGDRRRIGERAIERASSFASDSLKASRGERRRARRFWDERPLWSMRHAADGRRSTRRLSRDPRTARLQLGVMLAESRA